MPLPATTASPLPALQPSDPGARLLLFGFRQMAAHGVADAATANAYLTAFGKGFRRPLVLLRTLVAEMAGVSTRPIQVAPWCCPRMTAAEASLLDILARALDRPETASILLSDLLGVRDAGAVLPTAQALAGAFADLGLPL